MQHHVRYLYLSRFALIEITGSEAFAYLHRQITGDLDNIHDSGWMFTAWCQAKGRVICTFIVYEADNSLFLLLPAGMKERVIRRLSMYVLRSDVSIHDAGAGHALLGLLNIDSTNTDIFGSCTRTGKLLTAETCKVLELWGETPRSIVICKKDHLPLLMEKIHILNQQNEGAGWHLLDIETGMPWITETTSEAFLPQMLNLDQVQGLSYRKGCYPGQEVIARLHYRGELKRKMYLGSSQGDVVPAPGTALERVDTGARIGDVVDAERHPDGGFRLLAVADTSAVCELLRPEGDLRTSITLQDLRYPPFPAE